MQGMAKKAKADMDEELARLQQAGQSEQAEQSEREPGRAPEKPVTSGLFRSWREGLGYLWGIGFPDWYLQSQVRPLLAAAFLLAGLVAGALWGTRFYGLMAFFGIFAALYALNWYRLEMDSPEWAWPGIFSEVRSVLAEGIAAPGRFRAARNAGREALPIFYHFLNTLFSVRLAYGLLLVTIPANMFLLFLLRESTLALYPGLVNAVLLGNVFFLLWPFCRALVVSKESRGVWTNFKYTFLSRYLRRRKGEYKGEYEPDSTHRYKDGDSLLDITDEDFKDYFVRLHIGVREEDIEEKLAEVLAWEPEMLNMARRQVRNMKPGIDRHYRINTGEGWKSLEVRFNPEYRHISKNVRELAAKQPERGQ